MRAEGVVNELSKEATTLIYDRRPLFSKIRSLMYNKFRQSAVVNWNDVKEVHDDLFKKYEDGELDISMTDTQ